MPDIVLTTLNARYTHASLGLRYLKANLGELRAQTSLLEFTIKDHPLHIAERILETSPKIVGFGVYIWNVIETLAVVQAIKRLSPQIFIVLGGPEVSYETENQCIVKEADYVIKGEADLAFAELCHQLLFEPEPPACHLIDAAPVDVTALNLPYDLYTDEDIAHRILYVEASRGCPFSCEFCLSSLEIPVRAFPLETLLKAFDTLLKRGAEHLKFVDRTFNLNIKTSQTILEFLKERYRPGMFFHFEMVPDRLPEALRETIKSFPSGGLQFEVGIQTFNPETAQKINRRQNYTRLSDNLTFLRAETSVHIHADLIAGLPGENLESFAKGFDQLVEIRPHEIQVGILKRLRGTPISRHTEECQMVYNPNPPYELLQNGLLDFSTMMRLRRFARAWDLVANSGHFVQTVPLLWRGEASPFRAIWDFSDWLFSQTQQTSGIALTRLVSLLFDYLVSRRGLDKQSTAKSLLADYHATGHLDTPRALRPYLDSTKKRVKKTRPTSLQGKRQARHASA